jgi:hypothetical protein
LADWYDVITVSEGVVGDPGDPRYPAAGSNWRN